MAQDSAALHHELGLIDHVAAARQTLDHILTGRIFPTAQRLHSVADHLEVIAERAEALERLRAA